MAWRARLLAAVIFAVAGCSFWLVADVVFALGAVHLGMLLMVTSWSALAAALAGPWLARDAAHHGLVRGAAAGIIVAATACASLGIVWAVFVAAAPGDPDALFSFPPMVFLWVPLVMFAFVGWPIAAAAGALFYRAAR